MLPYLQMYMYSIHMYVCMYACMYCMDVCMYGWMDGWMEVYMHVCMYVCLFVRINIYTQIVIATGFRFLAFSKTDEDSGWVLRGVRVCRTELFGFGLHGFVSLGAGGD